LIEHFLYYIYLEKIFKILKKTIIKDTTAKYDYTQKIFANFYLKKEQPEIFGLKPKASLQRRINSYQFLHLKLNIQKLCITFFPVFIADRLIYTCISPYSQPLRSGLSIYRGGLRQHGRRFQRRL